VYDKKRLIDVRISRIFTGFLRILRDYFFNAAKIKFLLSLQQKTMENYSGNKKGICPVCQTTSSSVLKYSTRKLYHYSIGELSFKIISYLVLRCQNSSCSRKTFTHYEEKDLMELCGRSIYSKSTQNFAAQKMLKHSISYNGFQAQIQEDFGLKTAVSTLYTWAKKVKSIEVKQTEQDFEPITVLNTDEKHPYKKKEPPIINS
jgi:hypothetical protein